MNFSVFGPLGPFSEKHVSSLISQFSASPHPLPHAHPKDPTNFTAPRIFTMPWPLLISRTHPSRDVIFFGQILAKKRLKLFLYMTSGMQHCNLERCIDSMWMLTTALLGSRLQGQECKRETALASSRVIVHTSAELVHSILDLHCAQSILAYRQHRL